MVVDTGGTLNAPGGVTTGQYGKLTFKSGGSAGNTTFNIQGGRDGGCWRDFSQPPTTSSPRRAAVLRLRVPAITSSAATATFNVDGGTGIDAPGGLVTLRQATHIAR